MLSLSTLSKIAAPGLRIGWVRAPEPLRRPLTIAKQAADLHSSTVDQAAAARWLETVDLDERVGGLRRAYGARRDALLAGLGAALPPGSTHNRPDGGMFVWARLPDGWDAAALLERALEQRGRVRARLPVLRRPAGHRGAAALVHDAPAGGDRRGAAAAARRLGLAPSAASTRAAAAGIGSASPIASSGDGGRLVDVADAREAGQVAGARARVEALGVAPLALGERRRDPDLDERDAGGLVDRARGGAVGRVGRDERDERDDARLGEQRGGVRGAADVLGAVLGAEAEVAVEPVAQVVAVEPQRRPTGADQQRLDLDGERRLARRGQPGEPDRRALEAERGGAVLAR